MQHLSRFVIALACGLVGLSSMPVLAQRAPWARSFEGTAATLPVVGGTRESAILANDIQPGGDAYLSLLHDDSLRIDGHVLPAPNTLTARMGSVVHVDSAGHYLSTLVTGPSMAVHVVHTDSAGNRYVAGRFRQYLIVTGTGTRLDALPSIGSNSSCVFLLKLAPSGAVQWLRQGQDTDLDIVRPLGLVVDGHGYATLAGYSGHTTAFPGQPPLHRYGMVIQFDAAGNVRWQKGCTSFITALCGTRGGTLYLRAFIGDPYVTFGNDTIFHTPMGGTSEYLLRLDTTGQVTLKLMPGFYFMSSFVTDRAGDLYVAGGHRAGMGWQQLDLSGTADARPLLGFVAKLAGSSGTPIWIRHYGLANDSLAGFDPRGLALAADVANGTPRVWLSATGLCPRPDSLVCGPLTIPTITGLQGMVLQLDALSGTPLSLQRAGELPKTGMGKISASASGYVGYSAGFRGDSAIFNGYLMLRRVLGVRYPGAIAVAGRLEPDYAQVQGVVFADDNRNGQRDAGEPGWDRVAVRLQGPAGDRYSASDNNGHYNAALDLGAYTLDVPSPPRHYTSLAVGNPTATLSAYGTTSGGHHFALQPIPGQQDLQVFCSVMTYTRPGEPVRYHLTVRNVGTTTIAAPVLRLQFSRLLAFDGASLAATVADTTLAWTLAPIAPRGVQQVAVDFTLDAATQPADLITVRSVIEPLTGDVLPADNVAVWSHTMRASFIGPVNYRVNHATLTPAQVLAGTEALDYTVHFHNPGADTVFTVIVRDTLSEALLRLGTLELLHASHPLTWRLLPGGVLMVTFNNIQLPDSTTDALGSHGFVRFRLVPHTTLPAGTVITNRAALYFDSRAPLLSPPATTVIQMPTGLTGHLVPLQASAWPNPATHTLHVRATPTVAAPLALTLFDALGRPVRTTTLAAQPGSVQHTFDLSDLPAGLYIVRAATATHHWSQRVVVR